mmetsp:Transcript_13230/g.27388  ORF Transcript_13230/g.27388 Transcript_13230/m.27388 type:complete len:451 (+) Transcript_13230:82-1434(+)
MRISVLTSFVLVGGAAAFQPTRFATPRSVAMKAGRADLHEFDFILGEGNSDFSQQQQTVIRSRRKVQLPGDGSSDTVLASSTFAAPGLEDIDEAAVEEDDPYADILEESSTLSRYEQPDQSISEKASSKLESMDWQDIISTLIVPSIFAFAGLRWGAKKAAAKVQIKAEESLDAFATEMVYHDGDFEEMKLCLKSFQSKMVWLGPNKTPTMLKRYLQLYSKTKTVSPQSISSLSYVFSLFKLSEDKAAQILVSLCEQMGTDKLSSAGKLLFFGSRILKSAEGKAALNPIRDMIKSSYRDADVAEEMVETSQQAMAEAAYKSAVQKGGKNQQSLTVGWEVLGLDKDTATQIFEDEASEGFVTDREKMYGGQSQKYDKNGNRIDKEGKIEDPENAITGGNDDMPVSNVMECKDCGYTLFIAKGREQKFFGEGFKCPECGSPKDRFEPKVIEE